MRVVQLVDDRVTLSPSDLNDYVECAHLMTLSLEVARGERARPHVANGQGELLQRKGEAHEAAHLARLRAEGRQVVEISLGQPWDFDAAARATAEAMRSGAEVISQATFVIGRWRGRADFLERVDRKTALGEWGYEPLDAKLARAAKPTYVLQLCFYSDAVAGVQGTPPEFMHVLLGIGEQRALRYTDFAAYYRRVRSGFEAAIASRALTEPTPLSIAPSANSARYARHAGKPRTTSHRSRTSGANRWVGCARRVSARSPRWQHRRPAYR